MDVKNIGESHEKDKKFFNENNTDDSNKSIVSNFSETDIASEEKDISNIQCPEIATKY